MAVLSWGKPTLKIREVGTSEWQTIDTPVDGTTNLETSEGDKTEATEEGGGIVDTYPKKNKYTLSFELFVKKGAEKPLEDEDGVISKNYELLLTPEDATLQSIYIAKASVSCLETWTSADGGRWKYTFDALVPTSGRMLQKCLLESVSIGASTTLSKTVDLSAFVNPTADMVTIPSTASWLSKSLSTTTLTLTATENEGSERSTEVTVTNGKLTMFILVTQEGE